MIVVSVILLLVAAGAFPAVIALVAALAAPFAAYVVAARRFSGRINNSDASSLWQESTNLREEYREDIRLLRRELADCEERVGRVEERNRSLSRENADLRRTIDEHEETIRTLRLEVERLTADNIALRAQIEEG